MQMLFTFIALCFSWVLPTLEARELILFDKLGNQVPHYDALLADIKVNDVLTLYSPEKTEQFVIKGLLGKGKTTLVLEISTGEALRLPLKLNGPQTNRFNYIEILNDYYQTHKIYQVAGLPVPKLNLQKSVPKQYLVVEKVNAAFTFAEINRWLFYDSSPEWSNNRIKMKFEQIEHLKQKFEEFALKTSLFSRIGDFHPGQVVWVPDQDRWVLLDFAGKYDLAKTTTSAEYHNAFTSTEWRYALGPQLYQKLVHDIDANRKAQGCHKKLRWGLLEKMTAEQNSYWQRRSPVYRTPLPSNRFHDLNHNAPFGF